MPGDRALVAQDALDLGTSGVVQYAAEDVDGELVGERVGTEPGDALDVLRVADDVDRQRLAGAGLGDVEPGAVVEHHPGRERRLRVGPGRQ